MITHIIDSYNIPSQKLWKYCKQNCKVFFKVKAEKLEKIAKKNKFWNFAINLTRDTPTNVSD